LLAFHTSFEKINSKATFSLLIDELYPIIHGSVFDIDYGMFYDIDILIRPERALPGRVEE